MTPAVTVTVAVCTRNRAESLRAAVESLARLDTHDRFTYEVLVVDNASTDHTAVVSEDLDSRLPVPVRYAYEGTPGVAHARNRAIHECRGEWLAFFDDDQAADSDWLAELLALAERRNADCVGGRVVLAMGSEFQVPNSELQVSGSPGRERGTPNSELGTRNLQLFSPVCRMLLGESVGMDRERKYSATVTPGAGNLMVRRETLERIGGFDPRYGSRGEDTDLFLRLLAAGIDGWYTPRAIIHHIIPAERLSDEYLLRMAERMAHGMAEQECRTRGARIYPLIYAARLAQAAGILWPRYLAARLRDDRAAALGAQCRLRIARGYLHEGWRMLLSGGDPAAGEQLPTAETATTR